MKNYKHILVAVELNSATDAELIQHAERLAKDYHADVCLVHAIEHVGGYGAYGIGVGFEVEKALLDNAIKEMKSLGKKVGIKEEKQIVKVGPAKFVILEEADKNKIDLIVIGSHGRHGIRTILGSTANAVLNSAKCDVIAVRLKK